MKKIGWSVSIACEKKVGWLVSCEENNLLSPCIVFLGLNLPGSFPNGEAAITVAAGRALARIADNRHVG